MTAICGSNKNFSGWAGRLSRPRKTANYGTYVRPLSLSNYSNSDRVQTDGNKTITAATSVLSVYATGAVWKLLRGSAPPLTTCCTETKEFNMIQWTKCSTNHIYPKQTSSSTTLNNTLLSELYWKCSIDYFMDRGGFVIQAVREHRTLHRFLVDELSSRCRILCLWIHLELDTVRMTIT